MCDPQTFSNVSSIAWQAIKTSLKNSHGIEVADDARQTNIRGFGVRWQYTNDQLWISVDSKPFLIPCSLITSSITEAVTAQGGVLNAATS